MQVHALTSWLRALGTQSGNGQISSHFWIHILFSTVLLMYLTYLKMSLISRAPATDQPARGRMPYCRSLPFLLRPLFA